MNPEKNGMASVENADFGAFRGGLPFVGFLLPKISDRFRRLPEWIIQRTVESWAVLDRNGFRCFRTSRLHLGFRGRIRLRERTG